MDCRMCKGTGFEKDIPDMTLKEQVIDYFYRLTGRRMDKILHIYKKEYDLVCDNDVLWVYRLKVKSKPQTTWERLISD